MKLITAPQPLDLTGRSLFLAGGISNCPDWQDDIIRALRDSSLTLVNPRRAGVLEANWAEQQIRWEHEALHQVDEISFWFPSETLCPITLFELGAHLKRDIPLHIGVHPDYARKLDIEIQVSLERPGLKIHYSLEDLITELKAL